MDTKFLGAFLGLLLICTACQKKKFPPQGANEVTPVTSESKAPSTEVAEAPAAEATLTVSPELEKGKRLFLANCLQCHNRDPNMKGSIGPEMVDAPLEVMISKVMTGQYPEKLPEGFVPKRKTRAMRPIPKLKEDIPAIWAYVQSLKKKK